MAHGTLNRLGEQQSGTHPTQVDQMGFLLSENAVLHHLGFVVSSISTVAESFAASLSARWDGEIIHDPIQRVRVAFFYPADPRNPVFELVEPASDDSPVSEFLKKRGGLHHVCFEVDDLDAALEKARHATWVIASSPAPAVAFKSRRIAWIFSKQRLLMELLERRPK